MREIKFRAWDKKRKSMNYGIEDMMNFGYFLQTPWIEVMQYTGLNDKNGKEIYEGDVVKIYTWRDEEEPELDEFTIHKIKWFGEYPAFDFEPQLDCESNGLHHAQCSDETYGIEIIGNIHENSELLEVKNGKS